MGVAAAAVLLPVADCFVSIGASTTGDWVDGDISFDCFPLMIIPHNGFFVFVTIACCAENVNATTGTYLARGNRHHVKP